jgi:ADP-heptose:LPS heptosyltransferase
VSSLSFKPSSYSFKSAWKRKLIGAIDFLGHLTIRTKPLTPETHLSDFKNILVIRLDHVGDFILTLPAMKQLRDNYPTSRIDLVTDSSLEAVANRSGTFNHVFSSHSHWFVRKNSFLKKILDFFRLRRLLIKRHYDLAIDFRGDFRNLILIAMSGIPYRLGYGNTGGAFLLSEIKALNPNQHQSEININLISSLIRDSTKASELEIPQFAQPSSLELSKLPDHLIVIHAGAGYPEKIWPESNFKVLIDQLQKAHPDYLFVLVGTSAEKSSSSISETTNAYLKDLRGVTKIEDLFFIFSKKTILFIGNDSGLGHIASLYNIPIVCIFSHMNDSNRWKPLSKKLFLLTGDVNKISTQEVLESCNKALGEHREKN